MPNEYSIPTDSFIRASFKGKDLLEASNQNPKSSYEFKLLMEKLSSEFSDRKYDIKPVVEIHIQDFANFVYNDRKRSSYFTKCILEELHTREELEEIIEYEKVQKGE